MQWWCLVTEGRELTGTDAMVVLGNRRKVPNRDRCNIGAIYQNQSDISCWHIATPI